MRTTHRTEMRTRRRHWLAASGLMMAIVFVATPHASAESREWDIQRYDACIARGEDIIRCCILSDGDLVDDGNGAKKCVAPPALESGAGQAVDPPVLQNPRQPIGSSTVSAPHGAISGLLR